MIRTITTMSFAACCNKYYITQHTTLSHTNKGIEIRTFEPTGIDFSIPQGIIGILLIAQGTFVIFINKSIDHTNDNSLFTDNGCVNNNADYRGF